MSQDNRPHMLLRLIIAATITLTAFPAAAFDLPFKMPTAPGVNPDTPTKQAPARKQGSGRSSGKKERSPQEMLQDYVNAIDKRLAKGDLAGVQSPLTDVLILLRDRAAQITPDVRQQAHAIRTKAARAGVMVQEWEKWGFDGISLTPQELKFVNGVESRLLGCFQWGNSVPNDREILKNIDEAMGILGRDEFKSSANLKTYAETFAGPQLSGIIKHTNQELAQKIKEHYFSAMSSISSGNVEGTLDAVDKARELYDGIKMTKADMSSWTFDGKAKDEFSAPPKITLEQAMQDMDQAMVKSKQLTAQAEAARAKLLARWQKALKSDKARLYKSLGRPEAWEFTMAGYQPEDAAKSPWWTYYEKASKNYWWRTRYTFDGQQKLVNTEKNFLYNP